MVVEMFDDEIKNLIPARSRDFLLWRHAYARGKIGEFICREVSDTALSKVNGNFKLVAHAPMGRVGPTRPVHSGGREDFLGFFGVVWALSPPKKYFYCIFVAKKNFFSGYFLGYFLECFLWKKNIFSCRFFFVAIFFRGGFFSWRFFFRGVFFRGVFFRVGFFVVVFVV